MSRNRSALLSPVRMLAKELSKLRVPAKHRIPAANAAPRLKRRFANLADATPTCKRSLYFSEVTSGH